MRTSLTLGGLLALCLFAAAPGARAQGLNNLFISPAGEPFTAPTNKPYPVVDWFKKVDKNGDGKIDLMEFEADAEAFFKLLDKNGDGMLNSAEIYIYEHEIVPVILNRGSASLDQGGIIRVNFQSLGDLANELPNMSVDPTASRATGQDAPPPTDQGFRSTEGAAFFDLFGQPEPVMSADRNFDFRISRKECIDQADREFARLDVKNRGYLILTDIPQTTAERVLKAHR